VEKIPLPIYAIGGIKPENINDAKATSIRGVALISAITNAENPKEATQTILRHLCG
jgi:thiamine monophosphate synthase